jgi:hypothetical protein
VTTIVEESMPIAHERRWSVEDVWALPDDPHHRYETVDGELLVSPMPRFAHQRAVSRLGLLLGDYVQRQRVGEMMFSPYDVVLDPFTLMQPDVLVIAPVASMWYAERWRRRRRISRSRCCRRARRGPIACESGHGISARRSSVGWSTSTRSSSSVGRPTWTDRRSVLIGWYGTRLALWSRSTSTSRR